MANKHSTQGDAEVFQNLFVSIAEEMGAVLRRTAFSANIKERRDYSCAIYDSLGETIAMGDHMPVHLGAMPLSVRHVLDECRLAAGDVVIVNDPFRGGTHLPDITAVSAAFVPGQKKPAFYVANRAHHSDVGGMSPGSMPLAREIYQEGIRIPPVFLMRGGKICEDVMNLILVNVRTPEERRGDLLAQTMANRRGEQRLCEIAARYGMSRTRRNASALMDYSERVTRETIRGIPDGDYRFEDFLDSDGISAAPVAIRVCIRIRGGNAEVDFTGSAPQAAGPVNANYAIAVAASMYCFRCLIIGDVPYNAGLLRPIRVIAPERTVVNAGLPAAMAAGNVETSQRITDVILGALAQAVPDRIPAASSGTMNNVSFGGWDSLRNRPFSWYETIAGGMGASARADGLSAVHTHMTNSWNTPVEAFEHEYPVRITAYRIRENSGGKGAQTGGDGIVRELQFLEEADVTILSDRRERGPYGLAGGESGQTGTNELTVKGKTKKLAAKMRFTAEPDSRLKIGTPGGGGFGRPRLP